MSQDENDKLRAGLLPMDAFADADPFVSTAAPAGARPGSEPEDPFACLAPTASTVPTAIGSAPETGSRAERDSTPSEAPAKEPVLSAVAFHGLAGEIVRAITPHTEAAPVALLLQLLAGLMCLVGRGPHFQVGATRHYLMFFLAIVGRSARARKGTSWDEVSALLRAVDSNFSATRITPGGLVSGEGLVYLVRDSTYKYVREESTGDLKEELVEEGVTDKRLLVLEAELGRVLGQTTREGNTLSAILRSSWDGSDLASLSRNQPLRATAPHVAVIGHVTHHELVLRLSANEAANGFGNRFLWAWSTRSQLLPTGGALPETARLSFAARLSEAVDCARTVEAMRRSDPAERLWARLYALLSSEVPGALGSLTARAEAQTMRLACAYALLDRSPVVRCVHLRAATAVWLYCAESTRLIFGDSFGDPVTDELAAALRAAGQEGLTRTAVRDHFGRHRAQQVRRASSLLASAGLARVEPAPRTDPVGRPAERLVWVGAPPPEAALRALLEEAPSAEEVETMAVPVAPRATEATERQGDLFEEAVAPRATEATEPERGAGSGVPVAATEATEGLKGGLPVAPIERTATEATEVREAEIGRLGRSVLREGEL